MAKSEVKVLGAWPSPFVIRTRIALNIKSVEYEFLEETMAPKSELLLKSNPVHKKIPVLIHNDKPVCESLVIVEYVDEVWSSGAAILPADPYDRAIARFWATYLDEKWFPAMKAVAFSDGVDAKKAAMEQVAEGVALMEDAYVKCSKGLPFFGGNAIGFLDIAFGSYLGWLRVCEVSHGVKLLDEVKTPGLLKWAESFSADAAVRDLIPETDKLVEFSKFLIARFKASPPPSN